MTEIRIMQSNCFFTLAEVDELYDFLQHERTAYRALIRSPDCHIIAVAKPCSKMPKSAQAWSSSDPSVSSSYHIGKMELRSNFELHVKKLQPRLDLLQIPEIILTNNHRVIGVMHGIQV